MITPEEQKKRNRIRALHYYHTHKELCHQRAKNCQHRKRIEVLTYYGNGRLACVRCGYDDIRALSIDHIKGGGSAHRKLTNSCGKRIYYWLINEGLPEGFQTLCMNCQYLKREENNENRKQ